MRREDIIRFWRRGNLRRWSTADLLDVAIPEPSKLFLIEVGLPARWDWTIRFDDRDAARLPRIPNRPSYRRIGFDDVVPICLDERRGGCVVDVGSDFGRLDRYINSSVERLGECLVYYAQYRRVAQARKGGGPDDVAAVEQQMRRADPAAFADEESWWSVFIEEINYGLD